MTRIFISHKKEDSDQAESIALQLRRRGIEVYLDVLDPHLQNKSMHPFVSGSLI